MEKGSGAGEGGNRRTPTPTEGAKAKNKRRNKKPKKKPRANRYAGTSNSNPGQQNSSDKSELSVAAQIVANAEKTEQSTVAGGVKDKRPSIGESGKKMLRNLLSPNKILQRNEANSVEGPSFVNQQPAGNETENKTATPLPTEQNFDGGGAVPERPIVLGGVGRGRPIIGRQNVELVDKNMTDAYAVLSPSSFIDSKVMVEERAPDWSEDAKEEEATTSGQRGKQFYHHKEDYMHERVEGVPPTMEKFEDHPVMSGTYNWNFENMQFQIVLCGHNKQGTDYGFRRVSVQKRNDSHKVGISNRSEILLNLDASPDKIREAILENILRILDASVLSRKDKDDIRDPYCPTSQPILTRDYIFKMKKRSSRFSTAVYFCRLCDYHLPSIWRCREHMLDDSHIKARDERLFSEALKTIPPPTQAHCDCMTELVETISRDHGRSVEELQTVAEIEDKVTADVAQHVHKDLLVRVYGSCLSGVALKCSNINLELVYPEGAMTHAQALIQTEKMLAGNADYFDVRSDYTARWPNVKFMSKILPESECVMSVRNWQAWEIGTLIRHYGEVWPPFRKLAQTVRYWTKVCGLSDWEAGCLHSYAFDLMLIHYLQQLSPPALPVLTPKNVNDGTIDLESYKEQIKSEKAAFEPRNDLSLGALWLDFLKFYGTVDLQMSVIQISQRSRITREQKGWNRKRIAIEDPYLSNKNLARLSAGIYDYLHHCIQRSYMYFGIPQTEDGPLFVRNNGRLMRRVEKSETGENTPRTEETDVSGVTDFPSESFTGDTGSIGRQYGREELLNLDTKEKKPLDKEFWKFLRSTGIARSGEKKEASLPNRIRDSWESGKQDSSRASRVVAPSLVASINIVRSGTSKIEAEFQQMMPTISSEAKKMKTETDPVPVSDSAVGTESSPEKTDEKDLSDEGGSPESGAVQPIGEEFSRISLADLGIGSSTSQSTLEDSEKNLEGSGRSHEEDSSAKSEEKTESEESSFLDPEKEAERKALQELGIAHLEEEEGRSEEKEKEDPSLGSESGEEKEDDECRTEEETETEEMRKEREDLLNLALALDPTLLKFEMRKNLLTWGEKPEVVCSYCNAVGHFFRQCPDRAIPPIHPLPPMTPEYRDRQQFTLERIQLRHQLSDRRLQYQEDIRGMIEEMLQKEWKDARLSLFGSSKNEFGFEESDLDLCLRFQPDTLPEDVDAVNVIRRVAKVLNKNADIKEIIPVTQAKVPIVKFFHAGVQLEGDVSLYNILALRNTELMATYAHTDPRVKQLGYVVKVFAKSCDIGDASKGSLSSYAFIIMMIHYLQRCTPPGSTEPIPLLPVLQETFDGPRPIDMSEYKVDGWNTYFFKDISKLDRVWGGCGRNGQELADLWLGFLRFFSEEFNYDKDVVQIRQKNDLTKFEKLWTDKPMAVEDPFDLNHNLAAGLSKKSEDILYTTHMPLEYRARVLVFAYIRRSFIRAREVFGNPCFIHDIKAPNDPIYMEKFFFQRCYLNEGPPQDRQCRLCKRVGHFVENCPLKKSNRKQKIKEGEESYELEYKPRDSRNRQYNHAQPTKSDQRGSHKSEARGHGNRAGGPSLGLRGRGRVIVGQQRRVGPQMQQIMPQVMMSHPVMVQGYPLPQVQLPYVNPRAQAMMMMATPQTQNFNHGRNTQEQENKF